MATLFRHDEIIPQPGNSRLVIRSGLFDDLLLGPHPVCFEGSVYKPVHWHEEGKGLSRHFVYELEKIDENPSEKHREYARSRTPERQRLAEEYTRNRDRVQILALLWGTYPVHEQLFLEAKYCFAAAKWTAITASFLLGCAVVQILVTTHLHASPFALVGPTYLIFESLYRLFKSKVLGLPAASLAGFVLGLILRPPQ